MSAALARRIEFESRKLDDVAGPALLVDIDSACLVGANPPALAALGVAALPPGGLALDRATPALAAIEAAARRAAVHPFIFWTAGVSRTLSLRAELLPIEHARIYVLRALEPAGIAGSPARPSETKAASPPVSPPPAVRDDAAILSEIGRRIREGLGGAAPAARPTTAQSAHAAPAAKETPPPDRPWPGYRVLSERDLATLAHELRTPLATIRAMAEAVRDQKLGPASEKIIEYAGDIYATADHALEVLDATLGAAAPEPRIARIDANHLLAECVSGVRSLAEKARVRISAAPAAGLPQILADERTLKQILLNLLTNALKHTPAGGEIVASTAYRVDGPVRIEVRDTGRGMSEEDVAQIEAETEADRQGVPPAGKAGGLGLPLVRRLAAANGAEFGIDTKPGRGTRVFLTFGRDRVAAGSA